MKRCCAFLGAMLLSSIFGGVALSAGATAFPPPSVHVYISSGAAGGHPDLQVVLDQQTGLGFDQLKIVGPGHGSVAKDADIPDETVVGRLDADATTNAIVLPQCNFRVAFTVPIRKVSADLASPGYPAFLNTIAPGKHRLRLIADVSPSPAVPLVITYLLDLDPTTQSTVAHIFVGDPTHPPAQFQACTPSSSVNTLFGVAPNGAALFTAPSTGVSSLPFSFTFTSKPDAAGVRYTQQVGVSAQVRATDREPLPPLLTSCVVGQVIDGDTFVCGGPGGTRVNLMEVAAPAPGTCGGGWAQAALNFIFLQPGRMVRLDYGRIIDDKHGALVAAPIVRGDDGTDYNISVVMAYVGLARASAADGNTRFADWLSGSETWARVAQWNMWAPGGPFNGSTNC